jgi:DNA-binding Xre family transcriptional regulator
MQERAGSPGRLRLAELPDLTHDGCTRVRTAWLHAIDILLEDTRAAWKQFVDAADPSPKGRHDIHAERVSALKSTQRANRNAEIDACIFLFDAIATEYLAVDSDLEAYSERLRMVIPLVRSVLPVRDDHELILAPVQTRVRHWEQQRTAPSGTPRTAAVQKRETPAQVIERLRRRKGWTMEALAEQADLDIKQVYKVKRGNPVRSDTIGKLADALECPPGGLIAIAPRPSRARRNSPLS